MRRHIYSRRTAFALVSVFLVLSAALPAQADNYHERVVGAGKEVIDTFGPGGVPCNEVEIRLNGQYATATSNTEPSEPTIEQDFDTVHAMASQRRRTEAEAFNAMYVRLVATSAQRRFQDLYAAASATTQLGFTVDLAKLAPGRSSLNLEARLDWELSGTIQEASVIGATRATARISPSHSGAASLAAAPASPLWTEQAAPADGYGTRLIDARGTAIWRGQFSTAGTQLFKLVLHEEVAASGSHSGEPLMPHTSSAIIDHDRSTTGKEAWFATPVLYLTSLDPGFKFDCTIPL